MSMYNLLHGVNPNAEILKAVLGLDSKWPTGRFRDIYLNEDGTKIILYTRNGGGNREAYQHVFDNLADHPNYVRNWDDDFDCTYAYVEFTIPKEASGLCASLADGSKPKSIHEKFMETIKQMESLSPQQIKKDKRFSPIIEMLEKITKS